MKTRITKAARVPVRRSLPPVPSVEPLEQRRMLAAAPQIVVTGQPQSYEGSPYTVGFSADQPVKAWRVDWGDGTIDSLPADGSAATHTYRDGPAQFTLTVIAIDFDDVAHRAPLSHPSGEPDPSFGTNGLASDFYYAAEFLEHPDGRLYVAGGTGSRLAVRRYSQSGRFDANFGDFGYAFADPSPSYDHGQAIAIAPDGQIVVAGHGNGGPDWDFTVARFNPDGTLDPTFAGDGTVMTDLDGAQHIYAVGVQEDGKIVAAGSHLGHAAVIRYNTDGSIDTSFGDGGMVVVEFAVGDSSFSALDDLVIQPEDGSIVVAGAVAPGTDASAGFVMRILPDGYLDPGFGEYGGVAVLDLHSAYDELNALLLLPDGRIMAGGRTARTATGDDFALYRLGADGYLDPSFGTSGVVLTDLGGDEQINVIDRQQDGRIVVGGTTGDFFQSDSSVARYHPDGSLDTTFGDAGKLVFPVSAGYDRTKGIIVQPMGVVVGIDSREGATMRRVTIGGGEGVNVLNVLPELSIDLATTATTGQPLTVTFTSSDPGDDTVQWEIDWGDQTTPVVTTASSAQHTYAAPGNYLVEIIGRDEEGGQGLLFQRFVKVSLGGPQLVDGTLTIFGTAAGDHIVVETRPGPLVVVKLGQTEWSFPADEVEDVRVRTGAGTGRDTLVLGKGDYTFEAGAFDDPKLVLVANGALDTRQPSSIVFNGPQRLGFLWVNNPIKVTPGGDNTLVLGGISIPYGLAIDLADNSLIVQPPPNRTGEYEWLLEYIQAARNSPNGKWKGWGITSSAAASTPNTTLAFMPNPGLTEFEEQAVRPEDFLIAYTYDGDANLDGRVNSDDYFRIDSGFLAQPASPGYRDGDFNYDGKINSDDYFLIDSAFLGQGAPATSGVAVAASPLLATPSAPARNQPPAHDRLDRRRKSVRRAGLFGTGRNILD